MMAQDNRKPITAVETVKKLTAADVIELCDAAIETIESGGGFGWLTPPPRNMLEDYWKGVMLIPEGELVIGRIDGVVGASCQILRPPRNNEAQKLTCSLTTFFVAPWARGQGLAPLMLDEAEAFSRSEGFKVINLDVRATQQRAIQRYEAAGYIRFGEHPKYAYINDEYATGYYYYKDIQEKSERTAKHPEKG